VVASGHDRRTEQIMMSAQTPNQRDLESAVSESAADSELDRTRDRRVGTTLPVLGVAVLAVGASIGIILWRRARATGGDNRAATAPSRRRASAQSLDAVVVYESLFGTTRALAEAIAAGLRAGRAHVKVVRADRADPARASRADLLVVGGPTHAHGMSTGRSRAEAVSWTRDPSKGFKLDGAPPQMGLRNWLEHLPTSRQGSAAFDTRMNIPRVLSGAASVRIDRLLRSAGRRRVVAPASFVVTGYSGIKPTELQRARAWGFDLGRQALKR
jgi:hypothetical protein